MPTFDAKSSFIQVPVSVDTLIEGQFAGQFATGQVRINPAANKVQIVLSKSNAPRTSQGQAGRQKVLDVVIPAEVTAFFDQLSQQVIAFAVEVFENQSNPPA